MASPCEESRLSLWDKLVPDLQRHIYGLAVEQHCRELMQTQVCPGIIHAAFTRNQAAYQQVDDIVLEPTYWEARHNIQCAFEDALDAFLSSIASLPRHIRRMWIRQLRDVIPNERWSRAFTKRERERERLAAVDSLVLWLEGFGF